MFHHLHRTRLLVAQATLLVPLAAQTRWSVATPTIPIQGQCVATYDPVAHRAIVLSLGSNETWSVASQTGVWQQLTGQVGGPWYLADPAMTFDASRGRAVLFGGQGPSGITLDDTWEFDGAAWQLRNLALSPPARHNAAMCFDAAAGLTLLVAGDGADQGAAPLPLNDAWVFDGLQWASLPVVGGPSGVATAAYDPARQRTVVFAENGTFEWVAGGFVQVSTTSTPPPRRSTTLVYDALRERCVLYGGRLANQASLGDLWEYDGTDWMLRAPLGAPQPPHSRHGMVFDPLLGSVRLFAGVNVQVSGVATTTYVLAEELRYEAVSAAVVQSFAFGCSFYYPLFHDGLPWLGDTVTLTMPLLNPVGFAVFAFGFQPLVGGPVPLAAIGLPGCDLLVAPDVLLVATTSTGAASLSLPIPDQSVLLGVQVRTQALELAAPGIASNGTLLQIGGR